MESFHGHENYAIPFALTLTLSKNSVLSGISIVLLQKASSLGLQEHAMTLVAKQLTIPAEQNLL